MSATPSSCIPTSFPSATTLASTLPICAFNSPTLVPGLSQCCDDGAEVQVYNNCTQYCARDDKDTEAWSECVKGLLPDDTRSETDFICYVDDEDEENDEDEDPYASFTLETGKFLCENGGIRESSLTGS
ncbi:hypothetical protein BDW02DRAFT_583435 [Decorospora gaudefroyi]|uniref:Uncharacterized protein n=1 Tax=Decorospora gaudefroyi TaxID=184978 RepID=A0A6A5JZ45_9PLEO|nr:hypothetical protein BDW02DRAFT_583435 [Decorospora gaudefroyi]